MNINTGAVRPLTIDSKLGPDEVEVFGTFDQIEELSRRVKLGNAEIERRKKRSKIQKASRKDNR